MDDCGFLGDCFRSFVRFVRAGILSLSISLGGKMLNPLLYRDLYLSFVMVMETLSNE